MAATRQQRTDGVVLGELLAPFRADASPERFVCLVDDLEAMRVVALWPSLPKNWRRPRTLMPASDNERWLWIWDGVEFDEWQFAAMVELQLRTLRSKIMLLAAARILFPDGTVPDGARGILHAAVGGRIRTKPEPKRKATR
jgi:hypothetical protein